jgi:hypothetical protein
MEDPADMTAERSRRAALDGPVTGTEPDFLAALPMDNAVGAIVALTAEVYLLRERLGALESELARHRVLPENAVEDHVNDEAEARTRAAELAEYTRRILSELTRDRVPVSTIDPGVERYLRER